MTADTTLIRVPTGVRDRIRVVASAYGETFGQVINQGMDLIERERFWSHVGALCPDDQYVAEFAAWDDRNLSGD